MFKITQTKIRLFFACIAIMLFATVVWADTSVTVNDSFAPHGTYLRWDQFSTDLTAAVQNPPQNNEETTIAGPTYSWSVVSQSPSSPIFSITDSAVAMQL